MTDEQQRPPARNGAGEIAQLRAEGREDIETLITRILNLRAENDRLKSAASESAQSQPVAWRWRVVNPANTEFSGWVYGSTKPDNLSGYIAWECQALYRSPQTGVPK